MSQGPLQLGCSGKMETQRDGLRPLAGAGRGLDEVVLIHTQLNRVTAAYVTASSFLEKPSLGELAGHRIVQCFHISSVRVSGIGQGYLHASG